MTPAALIEQVEKICGPSVWQWPDDLDDGLFIEWSLRQQGITGHDARPFFQ